MNTNETNLSIKILGPGCANCTQLEKLTRKVLADLGVDASVTKVTDPSEYSDYDVMATPGLVINERVVGSGRIPSIPEITKFVRSAMGSTS